MVPSSILPLKFIDFICKRRGLGLRGKIISLLLPNRGFQQPVNHKRTFIIQSHITFPQTGLPCFSLWMVFQGRNPAHACLACCTAQVPAQRSLCNDPLESWARDCLHINYKRFDTSISVCNKKETAVHLHNNSDQAIEHLELQAGIQRWQVSAQRNFQQRQHIWKNWKHNSFMNHEPAHPVRTEISYSLIIKSDFLTPENKTFWFLLQNFIWRRKSELTRLSLCSLLLRY